MSENLQTQAALQAKASEAQTDPVAAAKSSYTKVKVALHGGDPPFPLPKIDTKAAATDPSVAPE